MTLDEFAKLGGFRLTTCDPAEWGGAYAYQIGKNTFVCGFKSKRAALAHWYEDRFGKELTAALKKVLRDTTP